MASGRHGQVVQVVLAAAMFATMSASIAAINTSAVEQATTGTKFSGLKFTREEIALLRRLRAIEQAAGVTRTVIQATPFVQILSATDRTDLAVTVSLSDWDLMGPALKALDQVAACKLSSEVQYFQTVERPGSPNESFISSLRDEYESRCSPRAAVDHAALLLSTAPTELQRGLASIGEHVRRSRTAISKEAYLSLAARAGSMRAADLPTLDTVIDSLPVSEQSVSLGLALFGPDAIPSSVSGRSWSRFSVAQPSDIRRSLVYLLSDGIANPAVASAVRELEHNAGLAFTLDSASSYLASGPQPEIALLNRVKTHFANRGQGLPTELTDTVAKALGASDPVALGLVSATTVFLDPSGLATQQLTKQLDSATQLAAQIAGARRLIEGKQDLAQVGLQLGLAFAFGGGASELLSTMSGPGSSNDAVVMQGLAQLSLQISQLREEMHVRFDRVDAKLDNILHEMQQAFYNLERDIGSVQRSVNNVSQQIEALRSDLTVLVQSLPDAFVEKLTKSDVEMCHKPVKVAMTPEAFDTCMEKVRWLLTMPLEADVDRSRSLDSYERVWSRLAPASVVDPLRFKKALSHLPRLISEWPSLKQRVEYEKNFSAIVDGWHANVKVAMAPSQVRSTADALFKKYSDAAGLVSQSMANTLVKSAKEAWGVQAGHVLNDSARYDSLASRAASPGYVTPSICTTSPSLLNDYATHDHRIGAGTAVPFNPVYRAAEILGLGSIQEPCVVPQLMGSTLHVYLTTRFAPQPFDWNGSWNAQWGGVLQSLHTSIPWPGGDAHGPIGGAFQRSVAAIFDALSKARDDFYPRTMLQGVREGVWSKSDDNINALMSAFQRNVDKIDAVEGIRELDDSKAELQALLSFAADGSDAFTRLQYMVSQLPDKTSLAAAFSSAKELGMTLYGSACVGGSKKAALIGWVLGTYPQSPRPRCDASAEQWEAWASSQVHKVWEGIRPLPVPIEGQDASGSSLYLALDPYQVITGIRTAALSVTEAARNVSMGGDSTSALTSVDLAVAVARAAATTATPGAKKR